MTRDEMLNLDNQLCFTIYTCSREITKLYRPFLEELGLTYTQYITLLALWEKDEVGVKDLGARLYLDSGTLTPLLKKLEAMGLIERTRDRNDERNLLIKLTQNGMKLKEKAYAIPSKICCGVGLSMDEIVELREKLKKLISNMKNK